ncbi:MAG: hypothetical protein DKM50_09230 [Candidatus Margulisiibacteriota bacterium]|nr:MAG: hypothetical protein DKM50_09230 [Candidatus Margulisiibacteriota bacterium]HCY38077.1 hypothetical protein [Candidatus Margulisiibacteriota bacterium]
MLIKDIPIYVMHYTKLVDRRIRLENVLTGIGLTAYWVTSFDQEQLDGSEYYFDNQEIWRQKTKLFGDTPYRILKKSEISLTMKHLYAFSHALAQDSEYSLFLEDDVVFCDNFVAIFDHMFQGLPADADAVFIGNGCNLRIKAPLPDVHFYWRDHPACKCTDSFLLKKSALAKILTTIKPFNLPIDFELCYQFQLHNLKVYWLEPPIVIQGSQVGLYESAIQ